MSRVVKLSDDERRRLVSMRVCTAQDGALLQRISRKQLAYEIGVSAGTIGHWENGRSDPTEDHLTLWVRSLIRASGL